MSKETFTCDMAPRLYTSSVAKVTMMEKKTNARLVTIAVVVSVEGGATTGDAVLCSLWRGAILAGDACYECYFL
jgi:hypothetical protein